MGYRLKEGHVRGLGEGRALSLARINCIGNSCGLLTAAFCSKEPWLGNTPIPVQGHSRAEYGSICLCLQWPPLWGFCLPWAWLVPGGRRGNQRQSQKEKSIKGKRGRLKLWLVITSLSAKRLGSKAEISLTSITRAKGTLNSTWQAALLAAWGLARCWLSRRGQDGDFRPLSFRLFLTLDPSELDRIWPALVLGFLSALMSLFMLTMVMGAWW